MPSKKSANQRLNRTRYPGRLAATLDSRERLVIKNGAIEMKKYLLFLITFLLSTGVPYAQVQFKGVEPIKPEKLEIPTIKVLSPNGGETWETAGDMGDVVEFVE